MTWGWVRMDWVSKERETDDVGVVKAGEKVDLCPDAGFVSLYVFFLDDLEGDMTGCMDEPDVLVETGPRDYIRTS